MALCGQRLDKVNQTTKNVVSGCQSSVTIRIGRSLVVEIGSLYKWSKVQSKFGRKQFGPMRLGLSKLSLSTFYRTNNYLTPNYF